jgi:RHS repeat-associated protein
MKKNIFLLILFIFYIKTSAQCEQFGTIVISEVYFDSHYNEDIDTKYHHFGEYIELFNSTTTAIDLKDWTIRDNHTGFKIEHYRENENTIIEPGGRKIIIFKGFDYYGWWPAEGNPGSTGAPSEIGAFEKFTELFPPTDNSNYREEDFLVQMRMVLYNRTDKVSLYNPAGRLIDEVSYYNGQDRESLKASAKEFMGIQEFSIEISYLNTPNGEGHLANFDGGVFNGPIGGFPILDQFGMPVLDPLGNPIYNQTGLYQKSLYLANEEGYYFDGYKNISIANATPQGIPLNIPLKDPHPNLFAPPDNAFFNYTHSIGYDIISNEKITESRTYFDDFGKSLVTLSHDFMTQKTWGSESVYDSFGRPFQTSFPSLKCGYDFSKTDFLSNSFHYNQYLAKYYSDENTENLYQSTATHPYTQVEYDQLNPESVLKQFGGNQINGEWKTGFSYTMPAAQEMYYVYGYDYFEAPIESNRKEINTQFFKTVTVDAHGVQNVAFTDGEGKLLATAKSGGLGAMNGYWVKSVIGTQGHVDVHIPTETAFNVSFLSGVRSDYDIWDLRTGILLDPSLPLTGGFYRVVAKVIPTSDPKVYVSMLSNGGFPTLPVNVKGITYRVNYYDYTINVYNKTGQLTRVVQPKAFKNTISNNQLTVSATKAYLDPTFSSFVTDYKYNTLGQLTQTTSADEGTSRFVYRNDGQIRYSQNAEQIVSNQVSYTDYDAYARPVESGVIQGGANIWETAENNPDGALLTGTKSEESFVVYDFPSNHNFGVIPTLASTGLNITEFKQEYLSGNVVMTFNENSATWYSYDIYGRVTWMVQSLAGLAVKTIHYVYNAKGEVYQVIYQRDVSSERFVHQYTYNFNGALEKVETTTKIQGVNETYTQAEYEYYVDGSLKRKNINNGLQGLDYVYTLGGMLKSINHPSLLASKDPGGDSNDVFGIILDYYSGDYIRPSQPHINSSHNVGIRNTDLYNGNIKAIRWAQKELDHSSLNPAVSATLPKANIYKYDRNGFLNSSFFGTVNIVTESSMQTINPSANNFAERSITYDANGNILGLQRFNNQSSSRYDNLAYQYNLTNNQLTSVTDSEPAGKVDYDIDSQPANNYTYNLRGQLTANAQENLVYTYNTQGLVTQVARNGNPLVKFYYNERGIRIKKESFSTLNFQLQSTEYYVTDASGHVMSIYRKQLSLPVVQTEIPIFGDTRLGVFIRQDHSTHYEITDHLGNVRTVIKRAGLTNTPFIDQYADYYPFGEQLPLRNSMSNYRYAFQGQEKDNETGMEAFQLRLWDGRIGRWLNPDPYGQFHSPYLGMGNDPINGIDSDGGWWSKISAKIARSKAIKAGLDVSKVTKGGDGYGFMIFKNDYDLTTGTNGISGTFVDGDNWTNYLPSQISEFTPNFWGSLSEGNIFEQMLYDTVNGFYTTSQIFMFRSVGDNSIRNLNRSATTSEQGVLGFAEAGGSFISYLSKGIILTSKVIAKGGGSAYDGVRSASKYLQKQGVPRAYRKQILESFDIGTISLRTADNATYGLRFYGGAANQSGRYLFPTFTNYTNRVGLALPQSWNSMSGISQFQIAPGSTYIFGRAASQGGIYSGGSYQMYINSLNDLIK